MPGDHQEHCHECGRKLEHSKIVWLELNCVTLEIAAAGTAEWSDGYDSQGAFPFGEACAKKVLETQKCNWV